MKALRYIRVGLCSLLFFCATRPGAAETHLSPEVGAAVAENAAMKSVVAELDGVDAAILAQNEAGFARTAAPEKTVNSPAGRVLSEAQAEKAFSLGLIDYASIDRTIEYMTIRPTGEVLWMGREVVVPKGRNHDVGKTLTYRVTEVWRKIGPDWRNSLRQATVSERR